MTIYYIQFGVALVRSVSLLLCLCHADNISTYQYFFSLSYLHHQFIRQQPTISKLAIANVHYHKRFD